MPKYNDLLIQLGDSLVVPNSVKTSLIVLGGTCRSAKEPVLGGTCRSAKEPGTYAERQQMTARKPVPPSSFILIGRGQLLFIK